jgi:hypothetical protein
VEGLSGEAEAMTTLIGAVIFAALIVLALYVFGVFSTPYLEALRFAFYLLLVLFVITVGIGLMDNPNKGYDPTVRTP